MVKLLSWLVFAIQVPNPIAGGLEVVDPPPLSEDMMGWWMDGGERMNGNIEKNNLPNPKNIANGQKQAESSSWRKICT